MDRTPGISPDAPTQDFSLLTFWTFRSLYCRSGSSRPLFLANGNHEGELGWLRSGTQDDLAVRSTLLSVEVTADRDDFFSPAGGAWIEQARPFTDGDRAMRFPASPVQRACRVSRTPLELGPADPSPLKRAPFFLTGRHPSLKRRASRIQDRCNGLAGKLAQIASPSAVPTGLAVIPPRPHPPLKRRATPNRPCRDCQLSAVRCQLSAVSCQLSAISYQLSPVKTQGAALGGQQRNNSRVANIAPQPRTRISSSPDEFPPDRLRLHPDSSCPSMLISFSVFSLFRGRA